MGERVFWVRVNGVEREVRAGGDTNLLEVLRNDLGLTGAKYGCGEGACGSCTVLVDGAAKRACVLPVSEAAGKSVTTLEGLAQGDRLHPLQEAFLEEGAMQCGYCVPGMIMNAAGLLGKTPNPTEPQILEAMEGNVCRCCGYPRMLKAIQRAVKAMEAGK